MENAQWAGKQTKKIRRDNGKKLSALWYEIDEADSNTDKLSH